MDIYKVLKKQRKSYKRFMLFMGFIFLLLPVVLWISKRFDLFFIIYICIIEIFIFMAVLIIYNEEYLKFHVNEDKLTVAIAGGRIKYRILCSKVAIIHTIPEEKNFDILIITKSKFRNKRLRIVTKKVLDKFKDVEHYYNKVKMPNEGEYYYFLVRRGGAKKYLLLDTLFKYCMNAVYTENSIQHIKEYRKSNKSKTS